MQSNVFRRYAEIFGWPYGRWIGKNPVDRVFFQQIQRLARCPASVPDLDDDRSVIGIPYGFESRFEFLSIESQRWRQLAKQWSAVVSQRRDVLKERVEKFGDAFHRSDVSDLPGKFYREAETVRYRFDPSRESGRFVPAVEGRIDFYAVEYRSIANEGASLLCKPAGYLSWDGPGGGGNDRQQHVLIATFPSGTAQTMTEFLSLNGG